VSDELIRAVSDLLGESVRDPEPLSYEGARCLVARLTRLDGSTIVVKSWPGTRGPLVRERVVLQTLAETGAADLVPELLAADAEGALLVMSDLRCAPEERLGEILEGEDRERAEAALVAHARALGRLHAATTGATALALAERLSDARPFDESRHVVHDLDAHLAHLPERLRQAGAECPDDVLAEVAAAREILAHPGPHAAVVHGDGTPANCYVRNGTAWLFDWETAAARHALLDGTYARLRYLQSVWAHEIPAHVRWQSGRAYRAELPWADADLAAGEAAACAAWCAGLLARLPRLLETDVRWGRTTMRQRVSTALQRLAEACDDTASMPATGVAARAAHHALCRRWPEDQVTLPVHRAWR
jgi:hypothetical protein